MAVHEAIVALDRRKDQILASVPSTFRAQLTFDRIRAAVASAIAKSDKLAACSPSSIYMSVLEIVGKGLDIGMDGQAYLVPFRGECTPLIGAQGKIELAYRSGMIDRIVCQVLFENDEFELDLANGSVEHKLTKDYLVRLAKGEGRGEMLGAYARIWVKGAAEPMLELMTIDQFQKIVDGAKRRSGGRLSPAYTEWPDEMLRRSTLNRALKRAPKSRDLMEVLNREMELEGDDSSVPESFTAPAPDLAAAAPAALPDHGEVESELDRFREPEREKVAARSDVVAAERAAPDEDLIGREGRLREEIGLLEADIPPAKVRDVRKSVGGIGPGKISERHDLAEGALAKYAAALKAAR